MAPAKNAKPAGNITSFFKTTPNASQSDPVRVLLPLKVTSLSSSMYLKKKKSATKTSKSSSKFDDHL
jgi:hypothetical protein